MEVAIGFALGIYTAVMVATVAILYSMLKLLRIIVAFIISKDGKE